jgi:hypothetical protein
MQPLFLVIPQGYSSAITLTAVLLSAAMHRYFRLSSVSSLPGVLCYFAAYSIAEKAAELLFFARTETMAMLMGACLYTLLNYAGQKWFVFKAANT